MKKYKINYLVNNTEHTLIIKLDSIDELNLPNIISIEEDSFSFENLLKKRIKPKDLSLLFYELDLMLQSNITLNDALNILIKNKKDKNILELLKVISDSFSSSKPIEKSLENFKLDSMIISFLKLCQQSGNIKENINALSKLLIEELEVKKTFLKSISYPIVLSISFMFSLVSIFYFVIPKFKVIFVQFEGKLPIATKALLFVEYIFQNYLVFIVLGLFFLFFILIYYYKTNDDFNFFIHKILIKHVPLLKDIYLNMEAYRLFFILNIMLDSKYEFHNSLASSKVLLKNKYVLDKITLIENLLKSGKQISESFENSSLFDDIVLNLLNTGEVSNSLPITINEIKKIYKNRFDEKVNRLINLIQPIFLAFMMALILWIVLAIFVPIWDMGNMIKM